MKRKSRVRRSAFTLIEVVVVIVILVTLASIATPLYMNYLKKANRDAAKVGVSNLKSAIETFRVHMSRYPETLQELIVKPEDDENWSGPYLEKVPKDPWGNEYVYTSPGENDRPYDIVCYGADGQPGGEGENADITSYDGTEENK